MHSFPSIFDSYFRIGRKKVFLIAIFLQIVCGFAVVVVPTWWLFALFRAGLGFSHPGIFVIAVVIGAELVGPRYRKLAAVITGGFFAIGQVLLGIEGYFLTDYRYLQLAIVSPALIFLSYYWLVPESARWLVTQRRFDDADKVLRKAAKMNGEVLPEKWWEQLDSEQDSNRAKTTKKYKLWDLMKTPVLRKRTLVAFYLWPVVSMVYYGMAMKPNALGGDIYINFIFSALVEIPALFIVYLLIDRAGRRIVLSGGYFLAGFCLLMNYFMGDSATPMIAIIQMMVTKGAITGVYASIYTYSPELFPTVIRNTAMGCCSTIARIGAISASYISLWIVTTPMIAIIQMMVTKGAITGVYASIYTYSPELFPTVIRNTAMGCCSTIARIGAISASYISLWIVEAFGKVYMVVPFAIMAISAGILTLCFLPETMGQPLPETIQEVEGKGLGESQELQPLRTKESNEPTKEN
ncbi:transporter, major facilitator family protein [Ostertagia ostertagi]